ncbi:MAG: response regulator [Piscirickettsiaceae bacterium]|nr:response regulator [Piscirickettsiaceae bacterium]
MAFIIGIILSSGQIYLDYFSQKDEINKSISDVLITANRAAFHTAYNLDITGAEQVCEGLVSNKAIVSASIYDDNGIKIAGVANSQTYQSNKLIKLFFGDAQTSENILKDTSVYPKAVGRLVVTVDPSLVADTFITRSLVVLSSGILRNFALAITLLILFYYTFTRPLFQASQPIQRGLTEQKIPMPVNHKDDEIGVLIAAFNDHLNVIRTQHKQIKESNDNLETVVEERTKELEVERQIAISASQDKTDFLAIMSHEIRTPMNGILGMAELLKRNADHVDRQEYVDAIFDSSRSLVAMMNSVLDFAKYEQGIFELDSITFNLHGLVHSVIFSLNTTAETRGIALTEIIGGNVPRYIHGDPEKLRQVFLNLINNSLKFTQNGSITLRVDRCDMSSPTHLRIRFSVIDTGIGISSEANQRIFEPYGQEDNTVSRRFGGTGLGLAICKEIVEKQGGKIDFVSQKNKGSTFWFELDFLVGQNIMETDVIDSRAKQTSTMALNILVVDDVEINRKLIKGQIQHQPWRTFLAGNGVEALEILDTVKIDVVLMDLHMPVMDGLETTLKIRQIEEHRDIKIIGNCAILSSEMREKCLKSGMDNVVEKPLDMDKLNNMISRLYNDDVDIELSESFRTDIQLVAKQIFDDHCLTLGSEKVRSLYMEAEESARDLVYKISIAPINHHDLLVSLSHALSGLCSNFGFLALGRVANALEEREQTTNNQMAQKPPQISQLKSLADATSHELKNILKDIHE